MFVCRFFGFLVVSEGPGLFRKVRGTGRIHFHQVSSKSDHGTPRNKQNREKRDLVLTVLVLTVLVLTLLVLTLLVLTVLVLTLGP